MTERKKVFISYAHRDDRESFVSRLGYSLDMYLDAFWDRKLQAGAWSQQLEEKIIECDAFIIVMSQLQRDESEWCKREFEIAKIHNKTIIPIKRFSNHTDSELEKYQFADFTKDFDEGFQQLTFYTIGERLVSWEYMHTLPENELFNALKHGLLPAIISNEIADWAITHQLWIDFKIDFQSNSRINVPDPNTPTDILRAIMFIRKQAEEFNNQLLLTLSNNAVDQVSQYINTLNQISLADNFRMGLLATDTLLNIQQYIEGNYHKRKQFLQISDFRETFWFNMASKLKSLIIAYSRKSMQLY